MTYPEIENTRKRAALAKQIVVYRQLRDEATRETNAHPAFSIERGLAVNTWAYYRARIRGMRDAMQIVGE